MIRIEKILTELETDFIGREILYFPELLSTNATAKKQAEEGAKEGTVIIAETQTEGRGRLDRHWFSPKGGVWLSIILRPEIAAEDAQKTTLTSAVAVARTLHKECVVKVQIKWPNDVLISNKKVCGILTEATLKDKTVNSIIVGIGINANFPIEALPEELQTTATTLQEVLGKKVDREKLIRELLTEFEDYYNLFRAEKFASLLIEWRRMADFLGKAVEVTSFGEKFQGKALDIDENGALMIKLENGEIKKVFSGDVSVRVL